METQQTSKPTSRMNCSTEVVEVKVNTPRTTICTNLLYCGNTAVYMFQC